MATLGSFVRQKSKLGIFLTSFLRTVSRQLRKLRKLKTENNAEIPCGSMA